MPLPTRFPSQPAKVTEHAREKLISKQLDAIVANDVSAPGAGFDSENNAMAILFRDKTEIVDVPLMSKVDAAHRILDEIIKLRSEQNSPRKFSIETR
jgi:phosphopantothenoylcysteine decarboxylase / phosphopantothenate---cysteine ligase